MSAMFRKRTTTEKDTKPDDHVVSPAKRDDSSKKSASSVKRRTTHGVLIEPYLTEKSSTLAERGTYTFLVAPDAEKVQIARAIAERYGVHPVHVRIIRMSGKHVRFGRTDGWRSARKKALITLQSGESIPFGARS